MGKNNKKKITGRCVATGKIVNGRNVIIADLDTIRTYLIQHGYSVFMVKKRNVELLTGLISILFIINLAIILLI